MPRHLTLLLVSTLLTLPSTAQAQAIEPVAIVDLRPLTTASRDLTRSEFAVRIKRVAGIRLVRDRQLVAALAGTPLVPEIADARAATRRAAQAFDKQNCTAVVSAAKSAALLLARAGSVIAPPANLADVYTLLLHCADRIGQSDAAQHAAQVLRGLGVSDADISKQDKISADVWGRYSPPTTPAQTTLRVTSSPPGAVVWLDHRSVGKTPIELAVHSGVHVVAASSSGHKRDAKWLTASGLEHTLALALTATPSRWQQLGTRVAAWVQRTDSPTAASLERVMTKADVRFAFVMAGKQVEVWAVNRLRQPARRLGADDPRAALALASLVLSQLRRWDRTGPDPNVRLITSGDDPVNDKNKTSKGPRWWVYASLVGAVAIGAGIIIARDLAKDRQQIEIMWPR